jgi:hypothetical protein
VAALAAAALALFLAFPTYPNYDAYYHLVWGRELLHGHAPGFEAYQAPTEHPLYVALCALLGLLGRSGGERGLVLLTVASLVALAWGTFRVGARTFGAWPGLLAAALVASSFSFLLYAVRAYVDVPFLALVAWAAAVETGRPAGRDRPLRVLGLLALAGLLRPEAWLLAGGYWLWRAPGWWARDRRRAVAAAALVLAAPVLWALVDLAVTGDPLHSLHATSDLADELNRRKGIGHLPAAFVTFLADTVRPPTAVAGALGALLAWRLLDRRRLVVPLALFAAGVLTFLLTGIAGLSILPRYLTVPAVSLCLFAGFAVLGFTALPRGAARRRWERLAALAAVGAVAFAVVKAPTVGRLHRELRFVGAVHSELAGVLRAPAVKRGLRCGPLTFPNYRLVPDARWLLDLPADRVRARSQRKFATGVEIVVYTRKAVARFGHAQGADPATNAPDPGFIPAVQTERFGAFVRCPGA